MRWRLEESPSSSTPRGWILGGGAWFVNVAGLMNARFEPVIYSSRAMRLHAAFRFRALAACAGRASLGGDREIALACLVAGRIASALLPPYTIAAADTRARSTAAKHWLSSLSLPTPVRSALSHLADAVASGNRTASASALTHSFGGAEQHRRSSARSGPVM